MSESDADEARAQIAVGVGTVAMGLVAVGLLAAGVPYWWMAFPIGGGLIPLALGIARWCDERKEMERTGDGRQGALDELRARYARGDLSDEEFEHRLERLLETETVENARESLDARRTPDREREIE
ncbi:MULTISPECIES: SHOCT domain-containing protein [Halorussus]|uniref:SHOCT domain-containing protein n=1 Tax=Halorussus TaxID=1070314 RepID=UPI000E20F506|nr:MULTISPECIES: SHOCT domain-containing protein [Halorussus]NHN57740.1 SHOCT domain-containing protein [Halorussus sp. JP-T4]